jgi:hypothetical protein
MRKILWGALALAVTACARGDGDGGYGARATGAAAAIGTNADNGCEGAEPCDRFAVPAGAVPYLHNLPLTETNADVTTAIVVVHGAALTASYSFQAMTDAAVAAGAGARTLVIAPRFQVPPGADCYGTTTSPAPGDITWDCQTWQTGSYAPGTTTSTFDVVDAMLESIASSGHFPKLARIVVAGHSAGGQFAGRYAAFSRAQHAATFHYLIANPSSYLYFDPVRLATGASCAASGGCTGTFVPYDQAASCPAYDAYPYGKNALYGYATESHDPLATFLARDVAILVGDQDTLANSAGTGMDVSCAANAEGVDRLARGITYWNYLREAHTAKTALHVIVGCDHDDACMYGAADAAPLLFGP